MSDNKGEPTKKKQQLSSSSPPFNISPPPPPPPLYLPTSAAAQFDSSSTAAAVVANPKRPRFSSSSSSQWKLLSPTHPKPPSAAATAAVAAESSDTATSTPTHSPPVPTLSAASIHDTSKPTAGESPGDDQIQTQQIRKGKFVSPVWKPNEMLWLAKAWRIQYQSSSSSASSAAVADYESVLHSTRSKTRAEKDREVADFLNRNGISRDAKTAGTKWDNMLGEFRKVYEWERGGERDRVGKSYFRLSPYERKLHRLPASFDEEVFDELSQFMGSRIRSAPSRVGNVVVSANTTSFSEDKQNAVVSGAISVTNPARSSLLLPPPPFKDEDFLNLPLSGRSTSKQLVMSGGLTDSYNFHSGKSNYSLLGFDSEPAGASSSIRRIGKVRMTWEESVSLWAEEGEHHRGRIKVQGSSFLNADELTFFDDSMVACTMESFEDDMALRGFSVDKFVPGQHIKVFGRKKLKSTASAVPLTETRATMTATLEYQDPTEYYLSCLRAPPPTLPVLFELPWYIQEPPPEELRFPVRKDVYKDLPHGKEPFFTVATESLLDSKVFTLDVVGPLVRAHHGAVPSSRDSFIGLWDDCINRLVAKFCALDLTLVRKPSSDDQWPNVTGFVKGFCLWRGEEVDRLTEGHEFESTPSFALAHKLMWTYHDLPYVLGYYAVGYTVTFCTISRSSSSNQQQIIRTDLYSLDLSSPSDRLRALVPCYRIGGLLTLLADRCSNSPKIYSDFERFGAVNTTMESTPNTMIRYYTSRRKWLAVKEIYEIFDQRIPHSEHITGSSEKELSVVFKPRGVRFKPANCEQLVESLKFVTEALVALHDMSFMHRDLSWEKVMLHVEDDVSGSGQEWFVCGFDEAVSAPQLFPREGGASGRHAPEMGRGMHGVKVDVWAVGELVRTCGLFGSGSGSGSGSGVVKLLRELQNRCLDQNPELRPTAADCYHHLSKLQSMQQQGSSSGGGGGGGGSY